MVKETRVESIGIMPRDKLLGERFKVQKWKWYLVDLRDFHKPVLVRKHLDNKMQAIQFRDKYYDKNFDVINYKVALKYGLRDFINIKKKHGQHTAKFNYPANAISQLDRQIFRNKERKKMKQKKRLPKVTETAVWEILDDQPVLFIKRLSHYRDNHWAYSKPVEGLKVFKKKYEWPKDIRHICNIVRVLNEYYNIGLYDMATVAIFIYTKWKTRIHKHCNTVSAIPKDEEKVVKELMARGFQIKSEMDFFDGESYVETIHINPQLAHPEICWHTAKEKDLYDWNIYDFQAWMGIPGYTRSAVWGLKKRT